MNKLNLKFLTVMFAVIAIAFTACNKGEIDVSGTVTDAVTTNAVEGVTVKAGATEATTAADGTYEITVDENGLLSFEKEGYVTQTESVAERETINVALQPEDGEEGDIVVTTNIASGENVTWETGNVYVLGGRIAVEDGATLTIEPGVIVKGEAGTGTNATALLVARGATLIADGSPEQPIIFTSVADEIQPGEIASPNLDPDLNGLWGGLIVLGNAPISADASSVQIEGIPPSDQNGLYGGDDENDNSGIIRYVSIRHGGANIGEGNEINGLTLGGVGDETIIEYVEIIANQDDGIECFGGTVNVSNIVVWNPGDDAYDMDQAYQGTIDNFILIAGEATDHGMELDGPEGTATGSFTLINGSLKGWNDDGEDGGEYADLRDGVTCTISNCYFFNFSTDSDLELDAGDDNDDPTISQNYINGTVVFSGLEFNTSHLSEGNLTIEDIFSDKLDGQNVFETYPPDAIIVTAPTVGADKSVFSGWSWAAQSGNLDDF